MTLRMSDVVRAVRGPMPHLELAVWDLGPFMKGFHYARKNMVFVECEAFAVEEVAVLLSRKYAPKAGVYAGVIKLREKSVPGPEGEIIVVARSSFNGMLDDKALGVKVPALEERAAELLAFASRKTLPLPFRDVVGSIAHLVNTGELSASKLHRFATRKYMGWLLDVVFYKLSEQKEIRNVSPSHLKAGKQWLEQIKEVEALE